jgi:hypothetical protein
MKHRIFHILSSTVLLLTLFALAAFADTDIDQYRDCSHCGMDRKAYGYSRMLVEYKDGKKVGTCSLHCVVTELNNNKGSEAISFKVADRATRKLIDAKKAFWVIGGNKRGVMTQNPKWAFTTKNAAQAFVDSHGGIVTSWDAALQAAREEAKTFARK